jgi:hypothetical protein
MAAETASSGRLVHDMTANMLHVNCEEESKHLGNMKSISLPAVLPPIP